MPGAWCGSWKLGCCVRCLRGDVKDCCGGTAVGRSVRA
ncbi:hypothetical protein STRTUCAR8_02653, partial [Streptomyces turgidiscabies Car8]